jgi:hypothetical protein
MAAEPGDVVLRVIFYGVAFVFALCTALALRRAFARPVWSVALSPQGIRDPRIASDVIPWAKVRGISRWSYGGTTTLVLDVEPAVEKSLSLTLLARLTRAPNRWFGADGLSVGAQGLNTDTETLFNTSLAYWQAARNRGHP